jgi:hypothetical protein
MEGGQLMSTATVPAHPSPLDRVHQRFERWRRTRQRRSPIPDALWALALKAARAHGLHRTARTLRLNQTALTQRLRAAGGPAGGSSARATFVELLPMPAAGGPACTLELETARGAKLRIHLQGIAPPDLAALCRAFWHAAR